MNDQPKFTLDELGAHWGRLLNQAFAEIITLEKQVSQLEAHNKALRDQVNKAEMALLAVQGKQVIDEVGE